MAKYVAVVVITVPVSTAAYFGWSQYQSARNTHGRVMEFFATDLTKVEEESALTYMRLSPRLKQRYSEERWRNEIAPFRSGTAPQQMSHETLADTFNTYPTDSDPQRYVYKYRIKDKDYLLSAVLYKQGNSWLVDEFQGDYR